MDRLEDKELLERLALNYNENITWLLIGIVVCFAVISLVATVVSLVVLWKDRVTPFKCSKNLMLFFMIFEILVLFILIEIDCCLAIMGEVRGYNANKDIQKGVSDIKDYYEIKTKGNLLYFNLKGKYRGLGILEYHATAEVIEEKPTVYKIEYEGDYFEIKK